MRQLPEAWRSGRVGSRQIKLGKRFGPSPSYRSLLVKSGPFPAPSDALARALLPCEKARAYGKPVEGNLCGVGAPDRRSGARSRTNPIGGTTLRMILPTKCLNALIRAARSAGAPLIQDDYLHGHRAAWLPRGRSSPEAPSRPSLGLPSGQKAPRRNPPARGGLPRGTGRARARENGPLRDGTRGAPYARPDGCPRDSWPSVP